MTAVLEVGRHALRTEGEAVLEAAARLDSSFSAAIALLAGADRLVVSGIGKSWLIAQKIAATLTSTGSPAISLHPIESLHGDLGLVQSGTVALLLSKSGETEELFGFIAALSRLNTPIVALTGNPASHLGRAATIVLDASVREEACPHNLAPTTSSTVALALGDALAVALLAYKGFRREDFAAFHPGGSLGRKLLLRTRDVMAPLPEPVAPETPMSQVAVALAYQRGIALIGSDSSLAGVITAGDLTRLVARGDQWLELPASAVMTTAPRKVRGDELAAASLGMMEREGIMAAPVLDADDALIGVVHLHDLLRAGAA